MYNEEQWMKMGKNMMNPLSDISKAYMEICHKISEETFKIQSDNLARFSEQCKRFSTIKKPEEYLNLQKECWEENTRANMDNLQKITQSAMTNAQALANLCGTTLREATSKTAEATEKMTEKATERTTTNPIR